MLTTLPYYNFGPDFPKLISPNHYCCPCPTFVANETRITTFHGDDYITGTWLTNITWSYLNIFSRRFWIWGCGCWVVCAHTYWNLHVNLLRIFFQKHAGVVGLLPYPILPGNLLAKIKVFGVLPAHLLLVLDVGKCFGIHSTVDLCGFCVQ